MIKAGSRHLVGIVATEDPIDKIYKYHGNIEDIVNDKWDRPLFNENSVGGIC